MILNSTHHFFCRTLGTLFGINKDWILCRTSSGTWSKEFFNLIKPRSGWAKSHHDPADGVELVHCSTARIKIRTASPESDVQRLDSTPISCLWGPSGQKGLFGLSASHRSWSKFCCWKFLSDKGWWHVGGRGDSCFPENQGGSYFEFHWVTSVNDAGTLFDKKNPQFCRQL